MQQVQKSFRLFRRNMVTFLCHVQRARLQIAVFLRTFRQKAQNTFFPLPFFQDIDLKQKIFPQTFRVPPAKTAVLPLPFIFLLHPVAAPVLLIVFPQPFQLLQKPFAALRPKGRLLLPFQQRVFLRKRFGIFRKGKRIHLQNLHRLLHPL